MATETVFVTGAAGLVGSQVVRELAENGHSVRALVRRPEAMESLRQDRVEPVLGDLSVAGKWAEALSGVTSVVDTTQVRSPGRLTVSKARAAASERKRITMLLLNSLRSRSSPLTSYVALSGLEDYATSGESWFDESTPIATRPNGFAHIGLTLRPVLQQARVESMLPLITLRMGLIYGAAGWFPSFVERARAGHGAVIGSGLNYNSLVSVTDVAQAIRLCIEKAPSGEEFIIADDAPAPQSEWIGYLSEAVKRPAPQRHVPPWIASLAVGRVNMESFVSSRRPRNLRMKEVLGVALKYPTYRQGFQAVLASLT